MVRCTTESRLSVWQSNCVSQAWMWAWSHHCCCNVDVSIRSQTIFTSAGFLYLKFYHLSQKKGSQKYPKVYFAFSLLILFGHTHLYLVSLSTWVRWPLSLSSQDQNCLNSLNSKKGASRFIMSFSREDNVLIVCYYFNWSVSFIYLYFILTYLILCSALLSEVKVPHK